MEQEYYTAKEVADILHTSIQTVYRKAKNGDLPSEGKRPNIKFPKYPIDAIAEVGERKDEDKLVFGPPTVADLWTKMQVTHAYEDEDAVPFKTILEWRKKNNEITMDAKEKDKLVGWVTFLPLEENVILGLISGEIRDKDISSDFIRKWSEKNISVYIPIIEVIQTGNKEKDKLIGMFLVRNAVRWAILLTIQHDIRKWYAVGVTPEGQALAEALGFTTINTSDDGKRKSYVLETKAPQVKLISTLAHEMKTLSLPEPSKGKPTM